MLYYKRLEPEAFAILSALRAGKTVANACAIGVRATKRSGVNWSARIKTWFNDWSSLGWFCRLDSNPKESEYLFSQGSTIAT